MDIFKITQKKYAKDVGNKNAKTVARILISVNIVLVDIFYLKITNVYKIVLNSTMNPMESVRDVLISAKIVLIVILTVCLVYLAIIILKIQIHVVILVVKVFMTMGVINV